MGRFEFLNAKQQEKILVEYSWVGDVCYMDHAGAALYSSKQLQDATTELCKNVFGNPHSLNNSSRLCSDRIKEIRNRLLNFFHTSSKEYSVIFTSGATAAIKTVLESFRFENGGGDGSIGSFVFMKSNHTSVVGGRVLASSKGARTVCLEDETVANALSKNSPTDSTSSARPNNSLFAYSAQCNFSGIKFPLEWSEKVRAGCLENIQGLKDSKSQWFTLLDAATFCATSELNLATCSPDFVCVSFYKIFGYPTGLGALLVRNESAKYLRKHYFGGGTVDVLVPSTQFQKYRDDLHERFEDGTLSYLSIVAIGHGLNTLDRLGLSMKDLSRHVFSLARLTYSQLVTLTHYNNEPFVEFYTDNTFTDVNTQGGIITFNVKRSDGTYIGYTEVLDVANRSKVMLRTGCFCNVGACQKFLNISDEQLLIYHEAGHVCGDELDLMNGKPTGAVRVSFGLSSTPENVFVLVDLLKSAFLEQQKPLIQKGSSQGLDDNPTLKSINIYPVKSCGAMPVASWELKEGGLHLDRQWMVVTSQGTCITQKHEPRMCLIRPVVNPNTETLTLTFDGDDEITIKPTPWIKKGNEYQICKSKICGDHVEGSDCGDLVANWLSHHLHRSDLRLVRQRLATQRKSGATSLANQGQYLVVNSNSVNWLRRQIEDEPSINLMTLEDRFRANLLVSGCAEMTEFTWKTLHIGTVEFKVDGPCTRCQMICIDQQTGESNRRPLVVLSRALEGKLKFGIYCSHNHSLPKTMINVGDKVTITYDDVN